MNSDAKKKIHTVLTSGVCPEEAIWLQNEYSLNGYSRDSLVHDKEKLYELGGTLPDKHLKWKKKAEAQAHGPAH